MNSGEKQHGRTIHCKWPGCGDSSIENSAYCDSHQVDINRNKSDTPWWDSFLPVLIADGGVMGFVIGYYFPLAGLQLASGLSLAIFGAVAFPGLFLFATGNWDNDR